MTGHLPHPSRPTWRLHPPPPPPPAPPDDGGDGPDDGPRARTVTVPLLGCTLALAIYTLALVLVGAMAGWLVALQRP